MAEYKEISHLTLTKAQSSLLLQNRQNTPKKKKFTMVMFLHSNLVTLFECCINFGIQNF